MIKKLRGNWLSQTRKINGHYQSGSSAPVFPIQWIGYGTQFSPSIMGMYGPDDGELYITPKFLTFPKYVNENGVIPIEDFEFVKGEKNGNNKRVFIKIANLDTDTYIIDNPTIKSIYLSAYWNGGVIPENRLIWKNAEGLQASQINMNMLLPVYDYYLYIESVGAGQGIADDLFAPFQIPEVENWDRLEVLANQRIEQRMTDFVKGYTGIDKYKLPPGFSTTEHILTGEGVSGLLTPKAVAYTISSTGAPQYFGISMEENEQSSSVINIYPMMYHPMAGTNLGYILDTEGDLIAKTSAEVTNWNYNGTSSNYYIYGKFLVLREFKRYKNHSFNNIGG